MNARRQFLALTLLGLPSVCVFAQGPAKIRRIGCLCVRTRPTPGNPEPFYDGLSRGMQKLGYIDRKNVLMEWRFADGKYERFSGLAEDLVRSNVELIVTHSTPATQ